MQQDFVLNTFLRLTPPGLLERYFAQRNLLAVLGFDFEHLQDAQPLINAIENLAPDARASVENDFREVALLANSHGTQLMLDAAELAGLDLADILGTLENHQARAMWLFLSHHPAELDLYRECIALAQVQNMSSNLARRLRGLPDQIPAHDDFTLERLGEALGEFFHKQGRGHRCRVEYRERTGRHYFMSYPEDYAASYLQYEGERLQPVQHRPIFDLCFVFEPHEGILDIRCQGVSRHEVRRLRAIFFQVVLGTAGVPSQGSEHCFSLNALMRSDLSFPTDPEDGIEHVEVIALRLLTASSPHHRLLVEKDPQSGKDVQDWLHALFAARGVPIELMEVVTARFRVTWVADRLRPSLIQTFTLAVPDGTSLRDSPRHQILNRYLKRWNLAI